MSLAKILLERKQKQIEFGANAFAVREKVETAEKLFHNCQTSQHFYAALYAFLHIRVLKVVKTRQLMRAFASIFAQN